MMKRRIYLIYTLTPSGDLKLMFTINNVTEVTYSADNKIYVISECCTPHDSMERKDYQIHFFPIDRTILKEI